MAGNQHSYWLNELNERLHPQQKYEQLALVKKNKIKTKLASIWMHTHPYGSLRISHTITYKTKETKVLK